MSDQKLRQEGKLTHEQDLFLFKSQEGRNIQVGMVTMVKLVGNLR